MEAQPEQAKPNRLIHTTSPYLLQHAHNPIDWWPWCDEALEVARAENRPILLSIGYSACHWCHVMAHESFENPAIASLVNAYFVPIKVDREERPDLDDVYMAATVAQTGSGGWPMSVFLTPELKPFYTGTYFPPTDRFGKPGFGRLLQAIEQAWREKPEEIRNTAESMCEYLNEVSAPTSGNLASISDVLLVHAAASLKSRFDEAHGGWGGAPKFPSSASVRVLLRGHKRTDDESLLQMAAHTLDCMAQGGIYDHVGGGFHRYSVDEVWLVPHFEKMLYDNTQLAVAYTEAYQATGNAQYRQVAEGTLGYLLRDMRHPEGAFYSAEDADSEGEEGKFYVWDITEIKLVLGEDAKLFCSYYNIKNGGNFDSPEQYHAGLNIPHITQSNAQVDMEKLAALREKLLKIRAKRVRPGLDDKVLTSWNALAISAFALAARVFGNAEYRHAAEEVVAFIRKHLYAEGGLLRTHRAGKSQVPGYLDDYAFLCNALVDLYECSFDAAHLRWAEELCGKMIALFWEEADSCFYFSEAAHKNLIIRPRPTQDGAEPAGSSVAAHALLRLSRHLDKPEWRTLAERAMCANVPLAQQYPQAAMNLLLAVDEYLYPGLEVVVCARGESAALDEIYGELRKHFLPNTVFAGHVGDAADAPDLPLLAGRTAPGDAPAVYVCRAQECLAPVPDATSLSALLKQADMQHLPML